jgi:sterol desaturase/sphingolipid hydroxylase (fatty acid hydroxylase superfamily)
MNEFDARLTEYSAFFIVISTIGIIFYLLTIIETIFDFSTKHRPGFKETMANVSIELGNRILDNSVIGAIFIIGFLSVEQFALLEIQVICVDFTYYWMHRIEHERRIFWAVHSVHHSSQEYNLTTALRLSWLESLYEWIFFIPLLLIGFDAVQILASLFIVVVYQTWIHTQKIGSLGWFDGIFNTPLVHRIHHATNRAYIDKNYGGILILWDRMFGTYQTENEKPVYGITQQLGSSNPLIINFQEFRLIYNDVIQNQGLSNKVHYVFGRTGWKPRNTTLKKANV